MPTRARRALPLVVGLCAVVLIRAQVSDPIPAPITNHGLKVEIREVAPTP
jgi:hypothetical protein